ncbi:MAG: tetratricopeptide repeat protein [Rickettsiales endosymbiont of Dermacentor nuttalli]
MKYWVILSFVFIISCSSLNSIDSFFKQGNLFSNTKSQNEVLLKDATVSEQYGDYKRAIDLYNKLIMVHPGEIRYLLGRANNLRLNKQCEEALMDYDTILTKVEGQSKEWLDIEEGRGLCYMQQGDFDSALDSFKRVIVEDATRWKIINAIGVIFALTNHDSEAIEYYNLAISIEPNYIIFNNLGLTQALNNKIPEAIESLGKALEYTENNKFVKKNIALNLALVYGLSGQTHKAEEISKPFLSEEQLNHNIQIYESIAKDKGLAKSYIDRALKP